METFALPHLVQDRIKAFAVEMRQLQEQIKHREALITQLVDGVLIQAGIDMQNSDLTVDLETMTVAIAPKGEGITLSSPEEAVHD